MVDAPRLERLFQFGELTYSQDNSYFRIKIGSAPKLCVMGYIQLGEQELVVVAGSKENIVPSVQILVINVQFSLHNAIKKVPGFLRCFPSLETLRVQVRSNQERTSEKKATRRGSAYPVRPFRSSYFISCRLEH